MGIAADISLIVVYGLVLGAIAHRLGQPMLLGYIVAGVLLGPHTGGISINDPHEIELLAEIGIALLLFSIGIEFSFGALRAVGRVALLGTTIQMVLTGLGGWALGRVLGFGPVECLWLGALVSVSSTMVVLKTLAGRGAMGTLSSRVMLGMLIAQDLAVIPLMIVMPQLSADSIELNALALALGRAGAALAVLAFGARFLVPRLMHRIVSWGSRELFVLSVITLGLGVGYLSHLLGLSYALGAFVAGLVLSESRYGHQALSDVIPLRDLFGLLFFASVGMLFDPGFLLEHLGQVLLLVAAVVIGKAVVFGGLTRAFGYHSIIPIAAALTMSQIGEFSFLLAQLGRGIGAIGEQLYALVVATTVLTMLLTPYLARLAPPIYGRWSKLRPKVRVPEPEEVASAAQHVVIAGGGRVGRGLARILSGQGIPVVLIEFDQGRMQLSLDAGWPVVFGDAAQEPVLHAAGIKRARLALVTVPAAVDAWSVCTRIRALNPNVPLVVRSSSLESSESLLALGALNVIQPEFEAAMEMAREALGALGTQDDVVHELLRAEREARFGTDGLSH